MSNEFARLVKKASELNWCTQIYCTTCANGEFRKSLRQFSGENGFELAQALADLDIDDFISLRNWDDCLRIAFLHLPLPGQHERILNNWVSKLNNIRFADVVLFYIVRSLSLGREVSQAWISASMNLAVKFKDESLVESLVWVLRSELPKYDGLLDTAKNLSATSLKVKRAMMKTGNLQ